MPIYEKGGCVMLTGYSSHTVDAKGRVFIPAKFRSDLGSKFVVSLSFDGCIVAHTPARWSQISERLGQADATYANLRRRIFGSAEEVEMDSQGRILLPERLRKECVITDHVVMIGQFNGVEIWNPERYDVCNSNYSNEDARRQYAELGL